MTWSSLSDGRRVGSPLNHGLPKRLALALLDLLIWALIKGPGRVPPGTGARRAWGSEASELGSAVLVLPERLLPTSFLLL